MKSPKMPFLMLKYCFHQTLSRESLPWQDIENRLLLVFLLWFDFGFGLRDYQLHFVTQHANRCNVFIIASFNRSGMLFSGRAPA